MGKLWTILILTVATLVPSATSAQNPGEDMEGLLIRDVSFSGNDAVSTDVLRNNLATRETRCRGLLLTPFCWITDWDVLIERHRVSPEALARDELRILVMYFREGFREATVATEIDRDGGEVEIRFRIDEGSPLLLDTVEIRQTEEVLSSRDLAWGALPGEGDPLSHRRIEEGLDRLRDRLHESGHLDAELHDSIVVGDGQAEFHLRIEPGPVATVAGFVIEGNEAIEDLTIIRALHVEAGDVLTTPLIRQSRQALHRSNLFHEANVTVAENADSSKIVRVDVREAPPRLSRIGGGFNTLEFVQLEGRFTHYNWRGGGRRVDVRGTIGNLLAPQLTDRLFFRDILPGELSGVDETPFTRPTWQASAEFSQPAFRAAENTLGFSLFAHRRVVPAVSVDQGYGAEVSLTRRLGFRIPLSGSYRYELVSVRAGDVYFCVNVGICDPASIDALRRERSIAPVTLSLQVERSDDALAPMTGYRGRVDLEHASGATLSDYRYNRASARASYYFPFGGVPRHVLAAHVRAGWVRPLGSTADALGLGDAGQALLHPRKRFYAGGARSVRGYAENQLGPRVLTVPRAALLEDDHCSPGEIDAGTCDPSEVPMDAFVARPIGGTSVLEGSVEYRFPVGTLTGAVFVDGAMVGGRVEGFLQDAARSVTPGFGVRFASPAGPIRIDLGIRSRDRVMLPVVTETESEPTNGVVERELIQLDRRRLLDPVEDAGFIGRVLGRLTLHFSIGEAF